MQAHLGHFLPVLGDSSIFGGVSAIQHLSQHSVNVNANIHSLLHMYWLEL